MGQNRTKIDELHDLMPKHLGTRTNPNWKAIIEAIGSQDQSLADLINAVRNQFSVKTASKQYLDRLGANSSVSRPRFIGMDDPAFRKFIPVFAYQPKQVKLIIDTLLDMFFFKESTTTYVETTNAEPFVLKDGWELEYKVDNYYIEKITFKTSDFTDISNATVNEIAAAINRQAQHSFAIPLVNNLTNTTTMRIFTNTVGGHGSLEMLGGRGNISLHFNGFIADAGNGNNTEWTITKIGDTVTFQHTAGNSPGLGYVKEGDIFISNIPGNIGSFVIETLDIQQEKFTITNLFATTGVITQTSELDSKFIRPYKANMYLQDKRAAVWETTPGSITVEMPTSPPVVKRKLAGSLHINGSIGFMESRSSDTSMVFKSTNYWPSSGTFMIQRKLAMPTRMYNPPYEDVTTNIETNTRIVGFEQKYEYTGLTYDSVTDTYTVTGITPNLPITSSLNQFDVESITVPIGTSNTMRVRTVSPHNYSIGEWAVIRETTFIAPNDINGTFQISDIIDDNTFDVKTLAPGTTTSIAGFVRVERQDMASSGSTIVLMSSNLSTYTGIKGPYIWDKNTPYVISSYSGTIAEEIVAGQNKKTIQLNANTIPSETGFVVLDFGTEQEEGPIKYTYKASDSLIVIDPSYIFKYSHVANTSTITRIRHKGAHAVSSSGIEYSPYVTDPSIAREILQDLILQVKSAGIFVEFLIRYPSQLYATIDVYRSGEDPG